MLSIERLKCIINDQLVFSEVTIDCQPGQVYIVYGANGSGKTTLLRSIAGLNTDYEGQIYWQAQNVKEQALNFRQQLHYIGHHLGLHLSLTPVENLQWLVALNTLAVKVSAEVALHTLGLTPVAHRQAQYLSAGQQRRVMLARLLMQPNRLWLLDEPLNALDSKATELFSSMITQHAQQGGAVIMASHQSIELPHVDVQKVELHA